MIKPARSSTPRCLGNSGLRHVESGDQLGDGEILSRDEFNDVEPGPIPKGMKHPAEPIGIRDRFHNHMVMSWPDRRRGATSYSGGRGATRMATPGGEESVVLFTSTTESGAMLAFREILQAVRNCEHQVNDSGRRIRETVGIGYAGIEEETDINKLLDLADTCIYAAKRAGKDRAVGCDSESPTGPAWVPHVKIAPQVGQSSQHPVCLRVEREKNPITFRPTDSVGLDRG